MRGLRRIRWTPQRDALLRAEYAAAPTAELAARLGVSAAAIHCRASQLDLRKRRGRPPAQPAPPASPPAPPAPSAAPPRGAERERAEWATFVAGGRRDVALRNRLLERYVDRLTRLAGKVWQSLPAGQVGRDDLVQEGFGGLVDASRTFDPQRGCQFWTLGARRARGAMLDYLRSIDRVPRRVRVLERRLSAAEALLTQRLGRPPTDQELTDELGDPRIVASGRPPDLVSIDTTLAESGDRAIKIEHLLAAACGAGDRALKCDEWFRQATKSLSLEQQTICYLYCMKGLTMQQVGAALGVSESRISQLFAKTVDDLRRVLRAEDYAAD